MTSSTAAAPIEVGEPFPVIPLSLVGEENPAEPQLVSLADFRGKKTVVHVFAGW